MAYTRSLIHTHTSSLPIRIGCAHNSLTDKENIRRNNSITSHPGRKRRKIQGWGITTVSKNSASKRFNFPKLKTSLVRYLREGWGPVRLQHLIIFCALQNPQSEKAEHGPRVLTWVRTKTHSSEICLVISDHYVFSVRKKLVTERILYKGSPRPATVRTPTARMHCFPASDTINPGPSLQPANLEFKGD